MSPNEFWNFMITKVLLNSSLIKKKTEKSQVWILGLRECSLIAVLFLILRHHRRHMAKTELSIGEGVDEWWRMCYYCKKERGRLKEEVEMAKEK